MSAKTDIDEHGGMLNHREFTLHDSLGSEIGVIENTLCRLIDGNVDNNRDNRDKCQVVGTNLDPNLNLNSNRKRYGEDDPEGQVLQLKRLFYQGIDLSPYLKELLEACNNSLRLEGYDTKWFVQLIDNANAVQNLFELLLSFQQEYETLVERSEKDTSPALKKTVKNEKDANVRQEILCAVALKVIIRKSLETNIGVDYYSTQGFIQLLSRAFSSALVLVRQNLYEVMIYLIKDSDNLTDNSGFRTVVTTLDQIQIVQGNHHRLDFIILELKMVQRLMSSMSSPILNSLISFFNTLVGQRLDDNAETSAEKFKICKELIALGVNKLIKNLKYQPTTHQIDCEIDELTNALEHHDSLTSEISLDIDDPEQLLNSINKQVIHINVNEVYKSILRTLWQISQNDSITDKVAFWRSLDKLIKNFYYDYKKDPDGSKLMKRFEKLSLHMDNDTGHTTGLIIRPKEVKSQRKARLRVPSKHYCTNTYRSSKKVKKPGVVKIRSLGLVDATVQKVKAPLPNPTCGLLRQLNDKLMNKIPDQANKYLQVVAPKAPPLPPKLLAAAMGHEIQQSHQSQQPYRTPNLNQALQNKFASGAGGGDKKIISPPPLPLPGDQKEGFKALRIRCPGKKKASSSKASSGTSSRGEELDPDFVSKNLAVPKPKQRMRTLNWVKLPNSVIKNKESIWNKALKASSDVDLNFEEIENLFSIANNDFDFRQKGVPEPGTSKINSEIRFICYKRSMIINILLKQFKCPISDVVNMIRDLKHKEIGADRLRGLLHIVPDKHEVTSIKNYEGPVENLGQAEQFYYHLNKLPNYQIILETLVLKEEFNGTYEILMKQTQQIGQVSIELMENQNLQKFFAVALRLGNFFNANQNCDSLAMGFRIGFLNTLMDTRSNVPRLSLLHYLLDRYKNESFLNFSNQIPDLKNVPRITMETLETEIKALETGVEKLDADYPKFNGKIKEKFCTFLQASKFKIIDLNVELNKTEKIVAKLAKRYCEDEKKFNIQEFFNVFIQFFERVEQAKKDNIQRTINAENELKRRTRQPNYRINAKRNNHQQEAVAGSSNGAPVLLPQPTMDSVFSGLNGRDFKLSPSKYRTPITSDNGRLSSASLYSSCSSTTTAATTTLEDILNSPPQNSQPPGLPRLTPRRHSLFREK